MHWTSKECPQLAPPGSPSWQQWRCHLPVKLLLGSQLHSGSSGHGLVSMAAYEPAMYVRSMGMGGEKWGCLLCSFWSVMLSMLCCCHKMCRAVCAVTTPSALHDKEVAAAAVLTGCFHHASIASSSDDLLKLACQWLQKARRLCLDASQRPVGVLWSAAADLGGDGLAAALPGNVAVCRGIVWHSELVAVSSDRAVTVNPPGDCARV